MRCVPRRPARRRRRLSAAFDDNLYNEAACRLVPITSIDGHSFAEFPADQRLTTFHRDDRKFVAVTAGCNPPAEVLNATDTDWWHHREALEDIGIRVRFLCPEMMR